MKKVTIILMVILLTGCSLIKNSPIVERVSNETFLGMKEKLNNENFRHEARVILQFIKVYFSDIEHDKLTIQKVFYDVKNIEGVNRLTVGIVEQAFYVALPKDFDIREYQPEKVGILLDIIDELIRQLDYSFPNPIGNIN